jgi:16S rRNA (guanine527-N7)-methyltransferase
MSARRAGNGPQRASPGLRLRASADTDPDLAADRAHALALVRVSRETTERLDRFVAVLLRWQKQINLIAPSTERNLWTRHVADSLQLIALAPKARIWADLGSGAGFPGMAIACALADMPDARVYLVEANPKKAAFLREAVRVTSAPAIVHAGKIEEFVAHASEPIDVVAARALAPLPKLLGLASPLLKNGTVGLFPKGPDAAAELTEASKYWKVQASLAASRTDPKSHIVVVRELEPKPQTAPGG